MALVFLDLKVSGSGFLGDGGLARISEKLAKEGHRALRIEATWPAEKALHASFLASLAEQIRTCSATTVVLLRAWDAETLRAIRAACGVDGKLLRLGTEVAALDDHFDAVVDVVGGAQFGAILNVLKRGGRYGVAGAIAGPVVDLDLRTLYLKDLTLIGCTVLEPEVFGNLIRYIEGGEIKPLVAQTFPLFEIVAAQEAFLTKGHVGKIVLTL